MASTNQVAFTQSTNIVPVQAEFNSAGQCLGLVGPGGAYFLPPIPASLYSGQATIDAAEGAVTITNANVTASSVIVCTLATVDDTLTTVTVSANSGSFTITGNQDATAAVTVNYIIAA